MKTIVIGAKGLAGSAFCRVFTQLGHDVLPIDKDNYDDCLGASCDVLVNANGNSAKYLAAQDPVGEIDRSVTSVMRTCVDFTFDRYVLLSSADVYTDQENPANNHESSLIDVGALSPYALCKYMAECIVQNRCRRWWILRQGGLLGPGLRKNPLYDILTGKPLRVDPESEFGFMLTDEVARITAHLLAQTPPNDVWNVCGDGVVTVQEMIGWSKRPPPPSNTGIPKVLYRINHDKLSALWSIPNSGQTVRDFIAAWNGAPTP